MTPGGTESDRWSTAMCPENRFTTPSTATIGEVISFFREREVRALYGSPLPAVSGRDAKQRAGLCHRLCECLDVVRSIVDVEGRPASRRGAETSHQRLRAVMSCPHAHAFLIEHSRQIVRV